MFDVDFDQIENNKQQLRPREKIQKQNQYENITSEYNSI